MPPKKDEKKPEKKKPEGPKELCGCGVNTYRPPPKGKKKGPAPIMHMPECSYQRATCNRYPHLPKCVNCEEGGCQYCLGTNPWCLYCGDSKCKFVFKRDVLGWAKDAQSQNPATADSSGIAAGISVPPSA